MENCGKSGIWVINMVKGNRDIQIVKMGVYQFVIPFGTG